MSDPWLSLCVGRPCIACGKDDGTIVPAHRNEGKGMSIKTDSAYSLPLCMTCHSLYDNGPMTRDEKRSFWRDCWVSHMSALISAGLVAPVGKTTRERKPERVEKMLKRDAWKERA